MQVGRREDLRVRMGINRQVSDVDSAVGAKFPTTRAQDGRIGQQRGGRVIAAVNAFGGHYRPGLAGRIRIP